MLPEDKFFETRDERKIWERYCGFLDLSIEDFMQIQRRLLMEQITLVSESTLGKKIMGGKKPRSVEEFRRLVPLTTYEDYEPYLSLQQEEVLVEKPLFWCHSSGRGGYFKWIPYTQRGYEVFAKRSLTTIILGAAKSKGEVRLRPSDRMLLLMPPRPYTSGTGMHFLCKYFSMRVIPPEEATEGMEFPERVTLGFRIALRTGVDTIYSIASILVKTGESMAEQAQTMRFSLGMLRPHVLFRLIIALMRSKVAKRPILPRDLWRAKAILTAGTDVSIYKDKIAYYWGQVPYEIYGGTEVFTMALQAWNKKWLTFVPDAAFWEFIPDEERIKNIEDPAYQPKTILLDDIEAGKTYEVVLTHFYGMPLLRYRIGDLITFISSQDEEAGVSLPQAVFKSKSTDLIALAGLAELDEKTLWRAIVNSDVKCVDWSARKEYDNNQGYLRLYMELDDVIDTGELERLIDRELKDVHVDYKDLESMIGLQPVRVTLLSKGTFQRYYEAKQKEGADLAHLKPPHMNASNDIIQLIMRLSQEILVHK